MILIWTDDSWKGYLDFFDKHQNKLIKCIHDLIKDIERNGPLVGKGKPEELNHDLSGYYSQRIDLKNRLVYKIEIDKLLIVQCGTHYKS